MRSRACILLYNLLSVAIFNGFHNVQLQKLKCGLAAVEQVRTQIVYMTLLQLTV